MSGGGIYGDTLQGKCNVFEMVVGRSVHAIYLCGLNISNMFACNKASAVITNEI
jgi:hypothetical protein